MSDPPPVWKQLPIGYPKQVESTVSVAAPLLAGFSLAAALQIVTGNKPWLGGYAVAMFAIATVLLLYALLLSGTALSHAATPSERLGYNPEARSDLNILQEVRKRQWEETALRYKLGMRGRICFHFGIFAFLSGFGLILVPQHNWLRSPGQFAGLMVVGAAVIIDGLWLVSKGERPKWLFPALSEEDPGSITHEVAEHLFRET